MLSPYLFPYHFTYLRASLNFIASIILWDREKVVALPFELEVDILSPITLITII